jgi:hypothetical protein
MTLQPDYTARWANITAPIRALYQGRADPQPLASKPITGFYLGDECYSGMLSC